MLSIIFKKLPWSNLCFAYLLLKNPWTIWCIPVPNLIFFIANFLLKTSNLWIWRKRIKATHDCACLLCRYNHSRNLNFHGFEPARFSILKFGKNTCTTTASVHALNIYDAPVAVCLIDRRVLLQGFLGENFKHSNIFSLFFVH